MEKTATKQPKCPRRSRAMKLTKVLRENNLGYWITVHSVWRRVILPTQLNGTCVEFYSGGYVNASNYHKNYQVFFYCESIEEMFAKLSRFRMVHEKNSAKLTIKHQWDPI